MLAHLIHFCIVVIIGPSIDGIDPTSSGAVGGATITITGSNFGTTNSNPSATFGGVAAPSCTWVSNTEMQCEAPAGVGTDHEVLVTVEGQLSNSDVLLSYEGTPCQPTAHNVMQPFPAPHSYT